MNNNQQKNHHQKQKEQLNKYLRVSGAGFQMLATIALGVFIGYKLDERYSNDQQIYTVIFSLLFIGIALYSVIKQVSKISKECNDND